MKVINITRFDSPSAEEIVDGFLLFLNAAKNAPASGFLVQLNIPALDQVQPTGTGGDEVTPKPRMVAQPLAHDFVALGAVVDENQAQFQGIGQLSVRMP